MFGSTLSERQVRQTRMDKIQRICDDWEDRCPTVIMVNNQMICEIDSDMIHRLETGSKFTSLDWEKLIHLLVLPKAPEQNVLVKIGGLLPAADFTKTFIWVREVATNIGKNCHSSWCVTVCKPAANTVDTYSFGYVEGERKDLNQIAALFGVQEHTMKCTYHQESNMRSTQHVPFTDAIVLDMLLDIIANDFVPHQRSTGDGLAFQLEILEAIEKALIETEAAKARNTSTIPTKTELKRKRVSIGDRLKGKKIKVEL